MAQQRRKLACKCQKMRPPGVKQRLLAKPVARQKKPGLRLVPDREREHAVEAERQLGAPLFVAMDEDFRIRVIRVKAMTAVFQQSPQFDVVVDFAVEDDADGLILVPHWLCATADIDDGKATMTEENAIALVNVIAVSVRAAMGQRIRHGRDDRLVSRPPKSGNPTHANSR